jgi:hypothetical protein
VEEATYEVVEDPEALWTGDVPEEFLREFEMRSLIVQLLDPSTPPRITPAPRPAPPVPTPGLAH